MPLNENLVTWNNLNIKLIEEAYYKISPLISSDYPDSKIKNKVKKLMEAFLPDYDIICDERNNPSDIVDSGNILVTVKTKTQSNGSYSFVDVIF